MCALFGVPRETLPEVRRSSGDFGAADAALSAVPGRTIPITGVAGDQQAALFGQGCVHRARVRIRMAPVPFCFCIPGTRRPALSPRRAS